MKNKIIVYITCTLFILGCDVPPYLSSVECDIKIREKYTNGLVTRLVLVGETDNYHPKWIVKNADGKIIFIQRYNGKLIEHKIF